MIAQKKFQLEQATSGITDKLNDKLIWQVDNRFDAIIAEIPKPLLSQVISELKAIYQISWDKKTIRRAPASIRRGAGLFAQMESGQLLYTHQDINPDTDNVMAAWWPWGPNAPASLRLFLADIQPESVETGFINKLKRLFA